MRHAAILLLTVCAGCLGGVGSVEETDETKSKLVGSDVPDGVYVNGVYHDVESDYLPHVVQCENGGAPFESLKAQAIAARTYLIAQTGHQSVASIGDGQSYQVYGCGQPVSDAAYQAVQETLGVYLTHNGAVANGQFVAGALTNGACEPTYDPTYTERYVTRNEGRFGDNVIPAPYPLANPSNPQNRGCLGQNLANCLAENEGYDALSLLRYFYGADIGIAGTLAVASAVGEIGGASGGSGGSGGSAPEGASCDALGYQGRCIGPIAQWAQDGQCKVRDCPAEGTTCGYISRSEGWGCLGVTPGGTTFNCADIGYAGDCRSNWLVWAQDGACQAVDCGSVGKNCGYEDDEHGFNCL